jgi:hypothetical protein
MHSRLPIFIGCVGGGTFAVGWLIAPGANLVLAISLVSGMTAALGQLTTRDVLSRAQASVDRAADSFYSDGGEAMAKAIEFRDRIEKIAWGPLICGVVAPAAATMRSIYNHPFWSGLALCFAAVSLMLAALLFGLNRILTAALDTERVGRAQAKRQADVLSASSKKFEAAVSSKTDPNLMGYGLHVEPARLPTDPTPKAG